MKWLFILLLVINLGIFAWGYQREQMEPSTPIAAGSDVGDMRMLTELPPQPEPSPEPELVEPEITPEKIPEVAVVATETETTTASKEAVEKEAEKEAEPVVENEVEKKAEDIAATEQAEEKPSTTDVVLDKQPELPQQADTTPETETKAEADSSSVAEKETVDVTESTTTAEAQADSTPGDDVKAAPQQKLVLVESEIILPDIKRPVADDKPPAPAVPEITSRCGRIGPIKDRKVAKKVLAELKKSKFDVKMERNVEKMQIGFWVVIPPLSDGSQAQAKIEELSRAGLKDIWHFRGGGLKNAISLGMFSKKENAENYSKELLKKGFKTKMQPRYLNKTNYLVNFSITEPKKVTSMMWRMAERKYSKMPFVEQSCEQIATR